MSQTIIRPIETEYHGYRFRSRLEARWAVFFDEIGADWVYEPEGYELPDGTRYLPDFLLHNVRGRGAPDIYVEVKGALTATDLRKITLFSIREDDDGFVDVRNPLIIFGQIPDCEYVEGHYYEPKHCLGDWRAEWIRPHYEFDYWKGINHVENSDWFYNLFFSETDDYWTEPKAAIGGGLVLDYPDNPYDYVDERLTAAAFIKARQARFEYGEHGGS